jgi:hypothetical protein
MFCWRGELRREAVGISRGNSLGVENYGRLEHKPVKPLLSLGEKGIRGGFRD